MVTTLLRVGAGPPTPAVVLTHAALVASCGGDGCPTTACPGDLHGLPIPHGDLQYLECSECGDVVVLDRDTARILHVRHRGRIAWRSPLGREGARHGAPSP
jgi:hypothetical protein